MPDNSDERVHAELLEAFRQSTRQSSEARWDWLMAAHIAGQHRLTAHWKTHITMLRFALDTRDLPEVAGQLFRLGLVPLGHFFRRLPAGNTGRATVSAFAPMAPAPHLEKLINAARRKATRKTSPPPLRTT